MRFVLNLPATGTTMIAMWWRTPHNPTAYDDDWEDQPGQGPLRQWGLGVVLAVVLIGCGGYAIVLRQAEFGGELPITLRGWNAVAFGIALISAGFFVHCHYFWGNLLNQAWFAVLGKIVAACGFVAGLGFVLVHNGILGIG